MAELLRDPVERALASAVAALSLSRGMFFAVSALYFTRGVGLSPAAVGVGLTVAGAVGVLAASVGGRVSDRYGADRLLQWRTASRCWAMPWPATSSASSWSPRASPPPGVCRAPLR
ncbi:MAG: hypothetical protein HOV67_36310 [Kribbellaceae bacterium]|nr:hypothetical protein [Kribbellaceae bacterium]